MRKWDSHLYLAHEIAFCADYLIKRQHGYPNSIFEKNKRNDAKTIKEWNSILGQIRDGFRLYYKLDGDFYEWKGGIRPKHDFLRRQDGTLEMKDLNKTKIFLNKEKERKFKTAMKLFVIYYEDLWD